MSGGGGVSGLVTRDLLARQSLQTLRPRPATLRRHSGGPPRVCPCHRCRRCFAEHTALADEEHQQLRLLVSEWQLLADLAFSDLVLWVPDRDPNVLWAAAQDLAAELPDKLHELQRLWLTEAIRHDVLPLDDRCVEPFNPDLAGRPQLVQGTSQLLLGGMGRLTEASMINVKNKPHTVTAQVEVPPWEPTG